MFSTFIFSKIRKSHRFDKILQNLILPLKKYVLFNQNLEANRIILNLNVIFEEKKPDRCKNGRPLNGRYQPTLNAFDFLFTIN